MVKYIISLLPLIFPGGLDGKASAYNAYHVGDPGSIPGLGRCPGEGNGNPLQHSCLENPVDGGTRQATVHGVAKSRTLLSDFTSLCLSSIFLHISFKNIPFLRSVTTTKLSFKWDGVGRRFRREGTYVYLWLMHVDVWQKPTQYCKVIILPLKVNIF